MMPRDILNNLNAEYANAYQLAILRGECPPWRETAQYIVDHYGPRGMDPITSDRLVDAIYREVRKCAQNRRNMPVWLLRILLEQTNNVQIVAQLQRLNGYIVAPATSAVDPMSVSRSVQQLTVDAAALLKEQMDITDPDSIGGTAITPSEAKRALEVAYKAAEKVHAAINAFERIAAGGGE